MVSGQLTFETSPKLTQVAQNTDLPASIAPTVFTSDLIVAAVKDDMEMEEKDFAMIIDVAHCRSSM